MVNLQEYKNSVNKLRSIAHENDISDLEIDRIFKNCFKVIEKRHEKYSIIYFMKLMLFASMVFVASLLILQQKLLTATILRNLQNFIYPGLKILRRSAIPIIERYPTLSEFYDEWCIFENPYFFVDEMDCWPCKIVKSVPDLTGHDILRNFNHGIPYTKYENISEVSLSDLRHLVFENLEIFEKDASRISSNNSTYKTIKNVIEHPMDLNPSKNLKNHISWRINRMAPARILRKFFPKSNNTPEWYEQSTEKFIFFDEEKSPAYVLPNTECSNVMVRSSKGKRLIRMIASPECSDSCDSFTILLSSGNTLWYNWWYWRPVSVPVSNSTGSSIIYLTSFC